MKLGNPWTFGILFMCAFCYFAWNNFELPKVFWTKTAETNGIVIESSNVARLPHHLGQLITFAYEVDDSIYFGQHKVNHAKYTFRNIGSKLKLQYAITNPSNFEVLNYYQFDNYSPKARYLWQEGFRDYDELCLENGIIKLDHKTKGGALVGSTLGQSRHKSDTIQIVPIFKAFKQENIIMKLVKRKSHKNETLFDVCSNKSYWRVTKS